MERVESNVERIRDTVIGSGKVLDGQEDTVDFCCYEIGRSLLNDRLNFSLLVPGCVGNTANKCVGISVLTSC